MKSFADWTDEIRALMNPPAPMVDTCNWVDVDKIKWDPDNSMMHGNWMRNSMSQDEFRKMYEQDWSTVIGIDLAKNGGDQTATAIAHKYDGRTVVDSIRHSRRRTYVLEDKPVYIMAPQLKIAEHWARDNGISPHRLCYMQRPEHFYGTQRGIKVFSVGNWMANKRGADIDQLMEIMKVREIELEYVNGPY